MMENNKVVFGWAGQFLEFGKKKQVGNINWLSGIIISYSINKKKLYLSSGLEVNICCDYYNCKK